VDGHVNMKKWNGLRTCDDTEFTNPVNTKYAIYQLSVFGEYIIRRLREQIVLRGSLCISKSCTMVRIL
jgi:hypothetical protein